MSLYKVHMAQVNTVTYLKSKGLGLIPFVESVWKCQANFSFMLRLRNPAAMKTWQNSKTISVRFELPADVYDLICVSYILPGEMTFA